MIDLNVMPVFDLDLLDAVLSDVAAAAIDLDIILVVAVDSDLTVTDRIGRTGGGDQLGLVGSDRLGSGGGDRSRSGGSNRLG